MSLRGTDRNSACDCALPIVRWTEHGALGKYVEIRLCCLAKALAVLVPGQKFYIEEDFAPEWEWPADRVRPKYLEDRSGPK